jgi:histidinol-phosphate aminotransferase
VAGTVRKVVTPFSTSAVAQAAAQAALAATDEMRRRCDLVIAERSRVSEAIRKLVPDLPPSQANFVWLPLGERSVPFATACAAGGVLVRPFPGEGVRVTIGTPEENDTLLALAEDALST